MRLLDRAKMTVSGTPGQGTISLLAAVATFQTFVGAGALNGDVIPYVLEDGTNWEIGHGTYSSTGPTLARTSVIASSAGGTIKISATSSASVYGSLFAEDLASVALSGSYTDLINTPSFAAVATSGAYGDLSGLPTISTAGHTGAYADLTGKPSLATVATTGAYTDLTGLPTLHTTLAGLTDVTVTEGVGIDGYTLNWNNTAGKWEAVAPVSGGAGGSSTLAGLTDVSIGAQTNTEVLAWKTADTKWEALALGAVAYSSAYSDLTGKPSLATVATSGAYSDLTGKPTLVTALSGLSDVTVTEGAGIDTFLLYWNNAATKWEAKAFSYANISGAPSLATVATSGAYSDLTGTPTVPTTLAALTGDVNITEGAGIANKFLQWNNGTGKWVATALATVATSGAYSDLSGAPSAYSLPTATATVLGGVKPDGTTITNASGAISVTYGTSGTSAAAGNDSRITGAVQTGGALGTPSSGTATNLSGTASALTAGNVTTNANLTGDVTSVGNAATLALGIAHTFTKQQNFGPATALTDAASIAWDVSGAQVAKVTLGGNRTMAAPTNLIDGGTYILRVKQDATGTRTLAYNSVFKWPGGTAPVLSTGANALDILTFHSDGTNLYGVGQLAFA